MSNTVRVGIRSALLLAFVSFCAPHVVYGQSSTSFLARRGTVLLKDGNPYRAVGYNFYLMRNAFQNAGRPWYNQTLKQIYKPDLFEKALSDARFEQIKVFRIMADAFFPRAMLLWMVDSDEYWKQHVKLMDAILQSGADLIVTTHWNIHLFLCLAEIQASMKPPYDTYVPYTIRLKDLTNWNHPAWKLTVKYYTELVTRYKNNPRIIAWDLCNEANLFADRKEPLNWGEPAYNPSHTDYRQVFSTEDMRLYLQKLTTLVRSLDSNHLVFPGYASPTPFQWHQWHDGTMALDTMERWAEYVTTIHSIEGIDAIEAHLYNKILHYDPVDQKWDKTKDYRPFALFGHDPQGAEIIDQYIRVGAALQLPLVIGEFGDHSPSLIDLKGKSAPFTKNVLTKVKTHKIPITLAWTWYPDLRDESMRKWMLQDYPVVRQMVRETNEYFQRAPQ